MSNFKFISTRGNSPAVDAPRAIFQGLAPDGGLYVPERIPSAPLPLEQLSKTSYRDLCRTILSTWLPGYTQASIDTAIARGYAENTFNTPEPVAIASFGTRHFIELFHGPTLAFKDLALTLLPHLLLEGRHLLKIPQTSVILTATSGDTGSAALNGFADVPETRIIVFYPEGGVSPIQEKQMTCLRGKNLSVCALKGNFDEAQAVVKQLFHAPKILSQLNALNSTFTTANSMNIGRLVPQIVYYFHAYGQLVQRGEIALGAPVNIAVPTGNFGNILSAWYAREMGLPVQRFICASNRNRVLTDFIRTGIYDINRPFHRTHSPSMDILVSSNLERLLFHLSGGDPKLVDMLMQQLKTKHSYPVPDGLKTSLQHDFYSDSVDDNECEQEIRSYYQQTGYVLDPHTAVASRVLDRYQRETGDYTPTLIAATASPFKFTQTVCRALFGNTDGQTDFELIRVLARETGLTVPEQLADIENWTPKHSDHCHPADAAAYVLSTLSSKGKPS